MKVYIFRGGYAKYFEDFDDVLAFVKESKVKADKIADNEWLVVVRVGRTGEVYAYTDFEKYVEFALEDKDGCTYVVFEKEG